MLPAMIRRFTFAQLRQVEPARPAGYFDEVCAAGTVEGEFVTLSEEAYQKLRSKYRRQWPQWAVELAQHRAPGDIGLGTTAEHVHGLVGSPGFGAWYRGIFKKAATPRCPQRLNRLFRYSTA